MIKRIRLKMAGALLAIGSVSLIVAMAALAGGCTHDPRTIRIDHAGAKGFDSPQELTDYQKQRIVEIILDTPEAKEQPPTESIYRTWLMWTAIVWDNSHYSYMSSFDLEEVESDPEYQTVPESAAWYPGATLYYGDPQAPTAEWLIQAHVDLDAGKVVYINSHPYSAAPLTPPPPGRSSSETAETRTYLTIEGLPPPMGEEAPDDIMPTPGGGTYRANVHQSGVENPWPPIESTDVVLGSGSDVLNVSYRDYIKTEAVETRNNIIRIRKEGGLFNSQLALYSVHVPSGIVLTDGGRGVGLPGTLGAILVIEIAQDVAPGEYPLEIGLEINGKDYGTVPCRINVSSSIADITIHPAPGSYLRNSFSESSGVVLKDVMVSNSVCDKKYTRPPLPKFDVGDPCLVISGHIQNIHEENSEIAMYAEGYNASGEQVVWTLDAAHIVGQIGLHLEYDEIGEFTLHLNISDNTSTIRIYANNYSVTPP